VAPNHCTSPDSSTARSSRTAPGSLPIGTARAAREAGTLPVPASSASASESPRPSLPLSAAAAANLHQICSQPSSSGPSNLNQSPAGNNCATAENSASVAQSVGFSDTGATAKHPAVSAADSSRPCSPDSQNLVILGLAASASAPLEPSSTPKLQSGNCAETKAEGRNVRVKNLTICRVCRDTGSSNWGELAAYADSIEAAQEKLDDGYDFVPLGFPPVEEPCNACRCLTCGDHYDNLPDGPCPHPECARERGELTGSRVAGVSL